MGGSQTEGRCRKHPKQTKSPGVCSSCLRERLSQISSSNNALSGSCSSSYNLTSCSSVSASNSESSSPHKHHAPAVYLASNSVHASADHHQGLFGRSRSVAVVMGTAGNGKGTSSVIAGNGKKRSGSGGFWSKLLGSSTNRRIRKEQKSMLQYSKTMKEVPLPR